MATSILPFTRAQIGEESTKGTLVPATNQLLGMGQLVEEQDFYRDDYPASIRATVGGAGIVTRKGVSFNWETDLNADEILWPMHTGILGGVTPATSTNEEEWTFEPQLDRSGVTVDSATVEFLRGDGETNHYYGEAGYCLTSRIRTQWTFNQVGKLSWDMFGRARQTGTPTGSLIPYADREKLLSNRLSVYWDTAWDELGDTQLLGVVRDVTHEIQPGLIPDYTLDGRSDVDLTKHLTTDFKMTCQITFEFDAVGAARFANYRANDVVFVRLSCAGSVIDSNPKLVQYDGAYRFVDTPTFSDDNKNVLMAANLEGVYDPTGGKIFSALIRNELGSLSGA